MDQQHMHLIPLKIWVYFHSGLFRKPVWHPWVLGWPSNGLIFPWQAQGWLWDCPWIELLCVTCSGKYDNDGSHLAVFSEDVAFARHFIAPHPPYRSTSGVCYASKKLSKMTGNSASYPVYSILNELPWIARETCSQLYLFYRYNKLSIWKLHFRYL